MNDDMRMTTAKWMEGKRNPFGFTGSQTLNASGIIHDEHTVLIVPRTERARMDMMLNWGQPINDERNKHFFEFTHTTWEAQRHCDNMRMACNQGELMKFNECWFDPKFIRLINKHYKRVADTMICRGAQLVDGRATPLRLDTPCGDWTVFIAPREEVEWDDWEQPKPKTFNPLTGEWE